MMPKVLLLVRRGVASGRHPAASARMHRRKESGNVLRGKRRNFIGWKLERFL